MKLRIKILAAATSILAVAFYITLIFLREGISLLEKPASTIGNIPENYWFFLIGVITGMSLVGLVLFMLAKECGLKPTWEMYFIPISGILTAIIPYKDEVMFWKIVHTALGGSGAIVMIYAMYKLNSRIVLRSFAKIGKVLPILTCVGTFGILLTSGLNMLMEAFYMVGVIAWMNIVAFYKE